MSRIAPSLLALLALFAVALPQETPVPEAPVMKKLTPMLFCEAIESSLPFWVEKLGFELTMSVPAGESLGFAMLSHGPVEVMLQSYASLEQDMPDMLARAKGSSFLFLEVEDLDAVAARLGDTEIVMPRRETFYGATEIGVRTPGGHYVTLAQMGAD